jgi:hypothetical protein
MALVKKAYDTGDPVRRTTYTAEKSRHYDVGKFFASLSPIALFIVIVLFYTSVVALGVFIGYQKFVGNFRVPDSPMETAVAAVFGLLAFILAFTFSLTWNRFANRNGLVIYQAKAIGVCYLRTSFLPSRQRDEIRKLLYEYTELLGKLPGEADSFIDLGTNHHAGAGRYRLRAAISFHKFGQ